MVRVTVAFNGPPESVDDSLFSCGLFDGVSIRFCRGKERKFKSKEKKTWKKT